MPEFPKLPIVTPPPPKPPGNFPDLPILDPDPPRMSLREKYGALFYAGIAGLVFSAFLLGSFLIGLYQARGMFAAIWVIHQPDLSEAARARAAWKFTHDPNANDLQRIQVAMRTGLPDLVRYVVAEGLTSESIRVDPKEYAENVARSKDWPDWLRLLMIRPMAYGAGEGYRIDFQPLDELRQRSDPAQVLWATYVRAAMPPGDASIKEILAAKAAKPGPYQELARLLSEAAEASGEERVRKLDEATAWQRKNHPPCARIWKGWDVKDGEVVAETPKT